ncbi:hypothetical protein [Kineococcus xinjiangensis]|uniref:hypothetical protein n=1 Tax=Kineococcus xinjiangensis TaxID=512762 RepID=UPI0011B0B33D|nr:hypothetical protein [Kineococcus xinjiangensis]
MSDDEPEVTRQQVEQWWRDVAEGRCSRLSASRWAQSWLDRGPSRIEELGIQGLLHLHALRHQPAAGLPSTSTFGTPDAEAADAFEHWLAECRRYDSDPQAWDRAYFRSMITKFAEKHGQEAADRFGRKLMAKDLFTESDLMAALSAAAHRP